MRFGYEAVQGEDVDDWRLEAYNCLFHSLVRQHPQVCKFDLAYMEAATGRRVHHVECMIRGGQVCRFKLGAPPARGLGTAKAGSRDDGRLPRRWREDSCRGVE